MTVLFEPEPENTSVPWTGLDVLLFLALWFTTMFISATVVFVASSAQTAATNNIESAHPIVQLVEQGKNFSPAFLMVAFLMLVIVAPLIEEFLFRLLLQGWLEAKLRQFRVPSASGVAIVAVSLCFASLHTGKQSPGCIQAYFYGFSVMIILGFSLFVGGMIYLVRKRSVKITSCLFGTDRFFHPHFFSRTGYCLLAIVLIFCVGAFLLVGYSIDTVRPIVIFFFALLLGTLYSRTKNLSYCILLHAFWNGTLLALMWLAS